MVAVGATVGVGGLREIVGVGTGGAVRRRIVGAISTEADSGGRVKKLPSDHPRITNPIRVTAIPDPTAIQGTFDRLLAELLEDEFECLAIKNHNHRPRGLLLVTYFPKEPAPTASSDHRMRTLGRANHQYP